MVRQAQLIYCVLL